MAPRSAVDRELALVYHQPISAFFKVYRPADPLCRTPPASFPALPSSPTNTNMHMHKGNPTDTHPHQFPRPPSSLLPLDLPPLPALYPSTTPHPPASLSPPPHLTRSLSRPEATASTCMAGCYVGAMTTVMNSTWRSRIQADVSLGGCRASNGAHISRE